MHEDELSFSQCVGVIDDHYRTGDPRAQLIANILLSLRHSLRQQGASKSLEQMTVREIIELVDMMFPR